MNAIKDCSIINDVDQEGNPTGGGVEGTGILIQWQDGPLGRDEDRKIPNGAFVETIISAAKQRLEFFQQSKFACPENQEAIGHLDAALAALEARTKAREERKVEGTHST